MLKTYITAKLRRAGAEPCSSQMIANATKAGKFLLKRFHSPLAKTSYKQFIKKPSNDTLAEMVMSVYTNVNIPKTLTKSTKEVEYIIALLTTLNIWDLLVEEKQSNDFYFGAGEEYLNTAEKHDESPFMFRLHATADALIYAKEKRGFVGHMFKIYDFLVVHAKSVTVASPGIHSLWSKIESVTKYITTSPDYRPDVLLMQIVTAHALKGMEQVGYEPTITRTLFDKRTCANCFKFVLGMKRCARCKSVHYCSDTCQTAHWKSTHKAHCCMVPLHGSAHA